MQQLRQAQFAAAAFDEGDMNLHLRPDYCADTVVVFLHGLGGSGYGTWGNFPKFVYGIASPRFDVAVYNYRSGARRLMRKDGDFAWWAQQLASHLRDLATMYSSIILVGHSQGGILAETVVRLVASAVPRDRTVERVAGLLLLGTPRAGSMWVNGFVARLLPTWTPLRRHGEIALANDQFFSAVETRNIAEFDVLGKLVVPTYVACGNRDVWVDQFSATRGVVEAQRRQFSLDHRNLAKPSSVEGDLFRWAFGVFERIRENQEQRMRRAEHSAAHRAGARRAAARDARFATRLVTDPAGLRFREAYEQIIETVGAPGFSIDDVNERGEAVDLVIVPHDANRVLSASQVVRPNVEMAQEMAARGQAASALISAVGEAHELATQAILSWIDDRDHGAAEVYVEGVVSVEHFSEKVQARVRREIERKRARFGRSLESDAFTEFEIRSES